MIGGSFSKDMIANSKDEEISFPFLIASEDSDAQHG